MCVQYFFIGHLKQNYGIAVLCIGDSSVDYGSNPRLQLSHWVQLWGGFFFAERNRLLGLVDFAADDNRCDEMGCTFASCIGKKP